MGDVDDLVTWLREVLDEVATVAREGNVGGDWSVKCGHNLDASDGIKVWVHTGMHGPRAVLARTEAERAIVDVHARVEHPRNPMCEVCSYDIDHGGDRDGEWPCETLRLLAWGHRHDAPGWREEWAPEDVRA